MPTTATKRIAERYVGPLNESETAQAIAAVRANVSELVSAAEALAAAGIYSKSCALSILAVEESQKVSMLLSLLYADTPSEQREIWKEFRNHRKKHINMALTLPVVPSWKGQSLPIMRRCAQGERRTRP